MIKRYKSWALLCIAAAVITGCGDKPLFDELATNRLKVVLKGTFESNGPRDWQAPLWTATDHGSLNDLTSAGETTAGKATAAPRKFMLDIAEMKLNGSPFANYRHTYNLDVTDTNPFFNGTGVEFDCDDPEPKHYSKLKVYLRKLIFNNGELYHLNPSGAWEHDGALKAIFKESTIDGFDFNQLLVNSYYDSLLEQDTHINRVFPFSIVIDDGGLDYSNKDEETVLEVRFVIKNFVKKYEYDSYNDDGYHQVGHYWAVSDWLREMKADEEPLGGNLLAVARAYVPGKVGSISGQNTTGVAGYAVAVPDPKTIADYFISSTAVPRPPCNDIACEDSPKTPYLPAGNSVESFLDYYLKYEQYKHRHNEFYNFVGTDSSNTDYEDAWNAYEDYVKDYRIPPLATYVPSGSNYSLENVPLGKTYNVYFIPASIFNNAELPHAGEAGQLGPLSVTVNGDESGRDF